MLALTVSGLVDPIVLRSSVTKTSSRPNMKKTPKTGYQSKKNSLMFPASSVAISIRGVSGLRGPAHIAYPSNQRDLI